MDLNVTSGTYVPVFLDNIIDKVVSSNVGCYMSVQCLCIIVYADDILLISPTVTSLQQLVNMCQYEYDIVFSSFLSFLLCYIY